METEGSQPRWFLRQRALIRVIVRGLSDGGDPFSFPLFAFRGKRGGLIKILWFDGQGMCLFSKRAEKGRFLWPTTSTGRVSLTPAQVSMLLEGIDWRMPPRVRRPELAG